MTNEMLIDERRRADRFFELWQTERDVFRDVKEFAEEKISGLEKERDELRDLTSSVINLLCVALECDGDMFCEFWDKVNVALETLKGDC